MKLLEKYNEKYSLSNLVSYTNIEPINLFLQLYHSIPQIVMISDVAKEKSFEHFINTYENDVEEKWIYKDYNKRKKTYELYDAAILLKNEAGIIYWDESEIKYYYKDFSSQWLQILPQYAGTVKYKKKKQPFEINLIIAADGKLVLKPFELKKTKLDIDLYYNDDFKIVHNTILKRLSKSKDKGIVLLHGLPGTGKTTYLRHLISKVQKRALFLTPSMVDGLARPELVQLLVNNPNTILVIEDAEQLIKDRRYNRNDGISNLLNLSDGLLADFLNIQVVCTFNCDIGLIDSALLREGRLIAQYEFGKLSIEKCMALKQHLKLTTTIDKEMTLAELTNPSSETTKNNTAYEPIGFKQYAIYNELKMKLKITSKNLRQINYPEGPIISQAMQIMHKHYKHSSLAEAMAILTNILSNPNEFINHEVLAPIAAHFVELPEAPTQQIALANEGVAFTIYGRDQIDEGAIHQMRIASKLPISIGSSLMPDAHMGYGLPIGGVLAVKDAVIPYGVGVDIGCSMHLSVYNITPKKLKERTNQFAQILKEYTVFGSGGVSKQVGEAAVLDDPLFNTIPMLKNLHKKAWQQLGTSGSGNHFVEWGVVNITQRDIHLGIDAGEYVGLLSHSGSRALGANIAEHYTRIAMAKRRLPQVAKHLAWLHLNETEGQEYWLAMNLAGNYASACHDTIHERIAKYLGETPIATVKNLHNFAWKESWQCQEVIVHRKGATPAGKNMLGIIPGSMSTPAYIVKGLGQVDAINSASHGAGRKWSRSKARNSITHSELNKELLSKGVTLLGGGLDEAPFAYKDINTVMQNQTDLVSIVGGFMPKIVKMDG